MFKVCHKIARTKSTEPENLSGSNFFSSFLIFDFLNAHDALNATYENSTLFIASCSLAFHFELTTVGLKKVMKSSLSITKQFWKHKEVGAILIICISNFRNRRD